MFRGKESSHRIELSRLVQDLLNFGVLGSLCLWWWGWMDGGVGGGDASTHGHMHTHACTHAHTHVQKLWTLLLPNVMEIEAFSLCYFY